MITAKYYQRIKEELDHCSNPLFFFDDDPDGLCSFLLLYRYKKEGHGCIVKARPCITTAFLRKVEEYHPDKIFVLDTAQVDQDFLDQAKVPVVWIDHHPVLERERVIYINPRLTNETPVPTSYMCYRAVNQDQWIAMAGCIADWFIPDFKDKFCKDFPELADHALKTPPEYLFKTQLGKLVTIISFNLKGAITEAHKAIKILTRINTPHEILNQETSRGKLLYKKYDLVKKVYDALKYGALMEEAKNKKNLFLVYIYEEHQISLTKDLSNELLYLFPRKVIILGRRKSGEIKCSLRSTKHSLNKALEKALQGIQGYGGGHEHACGCCIKEHDFEKFILQLKKELDIEN